MGGRVWTQQHLIRVPEEKGIWTQGHLDRCILDVEARLGSTRTADNLRRSVFGQRKNKRRESGQTGVWKKWALDKVGSGQRGT